MSCLSPNDHRIIIIIVKDRPPPKMFPWKLIAVTDVHGLKYFATRATKFLLIGGMSGARNSFLIAAYRMA